MTVQVQPDPAHHAGHALVRVWGAAGAAPGFHLRRPPGWEEGNLGPEGWQVADALLQPDAAEANGRDLVLRLGPRVCSHVEGGSYLFELPGAGISEVVAWPDIPYVAAPSAATKLPAPAQPPATPVNEAPAAPAPAAPATAAKAGAGGSEGTVNVRRPPPPAKPAATPAQPAAKMSRLLLPVGVLVLLVAAGGGGWYAWQRMQPAQADAPRQQADAAPPQSSPSQSSPPQPQQRQPPEARLPDQRQPDPAPPSNPPRTLSPPPPLSLAGLPVPDVIVRAPDAAAIRSEGDRRMDGGQKDEGLLLLEAAAVRGDAAALAALGKLYDPLGFVPGGPIPAPDARQSAKYYRDAARAGDTGTAGRRNALRAMLEQRAQGGDLSATLMLRDYWP